MNAAAAEVRTSGDLHRFLLQTDTKRRDSAQIMLDLREAIDALPETAATFLPANLVDHEPATIHPSMLLLTGAWKVPDYFPSGTRSRRYVNPNYSNKAHYSDVYAVCECGAVMVREELSHGESLFDGENDHTEDCRKQWRFRARARLAERRRAIMLAGYWHGLNGAQMAERLGFKSKDQTGRVAAAIGVQAEQRRIAGKKTRARTMAKLLERFKPDTVWRLYGVSAATVRQTVDKHTDTNAHDLYQIRRSGSK